jgi:N utilization substance protein B
VPDDHGTPRTSARGKARKRALDILFEADLRGGDPVATLTERTAAADPPVREYTSVLVRGVVEHRADIDSRIAGALREGWTLDRMPRVDRNLARIAVFEAAFGGLPPQVAVSEAVGLASTLSTDESPAFLNGVLTRVIGA